MMRISNNMALVCMLALVTVVAQLGTADATARLSSTLHAQSVELVELPTPDTDALQHIMQAATASLQSTYLSIDPMAPLFPDVVNAETGKWNTDVVNANGAAGLLAGCFWSMHKLTGLELWRSRALTASAALRSSVDDLSLGQAVATLAYPALRHAYEAETDEAEKALYLQAALQAANTLSMMFSHIPGVLKVRPTSHIAAEALDAGAAVISPFAVFSSVEGAAAATGLLAWASRLPGGRPSWRDIALMNSRRIVTDHMDDRGLLMGTLVYKSTSGREEPRPLSSWASSSSSSSSEPRAASSLLSLMQGEADVDATARTLEAWLSQVAGQESSPELRQALGTLALVEAARAAVKGADIAMFTSAVQVTASVLVAQAVDPLSMEPAAAAATAAALAELASLDALPAHERDEFTLAARHVVVTLAQHSLGARGQGDQAVQESLAQLAGRWVSSMLQQQQPQGQQEQRRGVVPGLTAAKLLLLRGVPHDEPSTPSLSSQQGPAAILSQPGGSGGSMLADHLLLQALASLTVAY